MGSLIFATLEAPVEEAELDKLKDLRSRFLDENKCVSDQELEDYVLQVIRATKHGLKPIRNVTKLSNWNFASAFLYSGTLVTTIGKHWFRSYTIEHESCKCVVAFVARRCTAESTVLVL